MAYVDQFTIDFFYLYTYTLAGRHIYINPNILNSQVALPTILMQTHIQRRNDTDKCYRQNMHAGEGAWQRWLVTYPDHLTYVIIYVYECLWQNMCEGEGAWRRLQK